MSTFNSKQIDQILSENDGFLRAIQEFQSMGKVSEVIEFQKRLQLNLLQLVDTVSSQFQSTKENPNSIPLSSSKSSVSLAASKNSNSHENLPSQDTQESNTRRKRSSFTDMPKI